jgi:hypothetical protein
MRVGHPALTAHFVLLWALYVYLRSEQGRVHPASQAFLGLVVGLIHPYLAAMTLALLAAMPLRARTWRSLAAYGAAVFATILGWWLAGFISVSRTADLAAGGLGLYSMNLLSPVTPSGWSTMLPELPVAHQLQTYEGFQYLGAGFLLLLGIAGVLLVSQRSPERRMQMAPLVFVCLLCAVYSLSPRITLGADVVVDWSSPLLDRVSFFRASGRFFWPMTYLLLTGAIAVVMSRTRTAASAVVLLISLALQFVDQHDAHAERRLTSRSDAFHSWARRLVSPAWDSLLPHYRRVVLVPPSQCDGAAFEHEELAYLAGVHGLTINSGLAARWDPAARRRGCGEVETAIAGGDVDDSALYVMSAPHEERLRVVADQPIVCGTIDGVRICVTEASHRAWRDLVPMSE